MTSSYRHQPFGLLDNPDLFRQYLDDELFRIELAIDQAGAGAFAGCQFYTQDDGGTALARGSAIKLPLDGLNFDVGGISDLAGQQIVIPRQGVMLFHLAVDGAFTTSAGNVWTWAVRWWRNGVPEGPTWQLRFNDAQPDTRHAWFVSGVFAGDEIELYATITGGASNPEITGPLLYEAFYLTTLTGSVAGTSPSGGGGSDTFLGLSDTPSSYSGQAGKLVAVNSGESAVEFVAPETGTAPVASVFGRTGAVTANSGDYTAAKITCSPTGHSYITATDVETAIDQIDALLNPPTVYKIAVIGDSQTVRPHGDAWPIRLVDLFEEHGIAVEMRVIPPFTWDGVDDDTLFYEGSAVDVVAAMQPDLAIVALGGNDVLDSGTTYATIEAAAHDMLDALDAAMTGHILVLNEVWWDQTHYTSSAGSALNRQVYPFMQGRSNVTNEDDCVSEEMLATSLSTLDSLRDTGTKWLFDLKTNLDTWVPANITNGHTGDYDVYLIGRLGLCSDGNHPTIPGARLLAGDVLNTIAGLSLPGLETLQADTLYNASGFFDIVLDDGGSDWDIGDDGRTWNLANELGITDFPSRLSRWWATPFYWRMDGLIPVTSGGVLKLNSSNRWVRFSGLPSGAVVSFKRWDNAGSEPTSFDATTYLTDDNGCFTWIDGGSLVTNIALKLKIERTGAQGFIIGKLVFNTS